MPAVSVIIPVFNGELYIAAAIESVLAQSLPAHEVIVVDDGSTDRSAEIVRGFGTRLDVVAQENRGLPAARNRGLDLATGEFVAFLDCDDLWAPEFLVKTSAKLAGLDADVCGVGVGWASIDGRGREFPGSRKSLGPNLGIDSLVQRNPFPPSTVLFRRGAVEEVGRFDAELRSFSEDWDLSLRLCLAGYRYEWLSECLCFYRLHASSMSADLERRRRGGRQVLEKLFSRPDLPERIAARRSEVLAVDAATLSALSFAAGDAAAAKSEFVRAVRLWPGVLELDETFWSIVCADQVGSKATAIGLNLAAGAARLLDVLAECSALGLPSAPEQRRRAYANAYRALAQLAHIAGDGGAARRYAWSALRARPSGWRDPGVAKTFLQSLLGPLAPRRRRRNGAPG